MGTAEGVTFTIRGNLCWVHLNATRPLYRSIFTATAGRMLRAIQVAAAHAIFNTDENVLLTASTASGKTEAAFFPIITLFSEDMPALGGLPSTLAL